MKSYRTILGLPLVLAALVAVAGCHTSGDGNRSAGRVLDDKIASNKVETALRDAPTYKFDSVKVTTYRGVVQLSGWVASNEQKDVAERIARNVHGIADVVNNISVSDADSKTLPTSQGGVP
jgi:hyperosmotically inducible protein